MGCVELEFPSRGTACATIAGISSLACAPLWCAGVWVWVWACARASVHASHYATQGARPAACNRSVHVGCDECGPCTMVRLSRVLFASGWARAFCSARVGNVVSRLSTVLAPCAHCGIVKSRTKHARWAIYPLLLRVGDCFQPRIASVCLNKLRRFSELCFVCLSVCPCGVWVFSQGASSAGCVTTKRSHTSLSTSRLRTFGFRYDIGVDFHGRAAVARQSSRQRRRWVGSLPLMAGMLGHSAAVGGILRQRWRVIYPLVHGVFACCCNGCLFFMRS